MIEFKISKYSKTSVEFVVSECVSVSDKEWICKTCDNALNRGKLPAQAKVNNLDHDDVPPELSDLNPLKVHLISLHEDPLHEDGGTPLWQATCHSWASYQATNIK